jgi:hypothetical protein
MPDPNLDAFVADTTELNAWFADIKKLTTFLGSTGATADAFNASLSGTLGTLMKQAKAEQDKLLGESAPPNPSSQVSQFENLVAEQADASAAPLSAAYALDLQQGAAVKTIVQNATTAVTAFQAPFAAMASRFTAYRATEAAELATYATYSSAGATTTLTTMPAVEQEILSYNQQLGPIPDQFIADATGLRMSIASAGAQFAAQLDTYTAFMNQFGMNRPDLTSSAIHSLDNMIAYVEDRRQRNDAVATRLLDDLTLRRQALILIATSQATQATIAQAELLSASTTFLNNATQQISALWAAPPTSTKLKLPYLAARYDLFTAFLQLQPLCATGATGSWRETGCNSLNQQFASAQAYQTTTLPGQIKIGVMLMTGSAAPAALLSDITAKLAAGNVKGAAAEYDEALLASDG